MIYTVYILYSISFDKYYVGYTGDIIVQRLRRHNSKHNGFTGGSGDWVVKYTEVFDDKQNAFNREKEIKSKKSRKYIESLIAHSV